MLHYTKKTASILLLGALILATVLPSTLLRPAAAQVLPIVGIWSSTHSSSNITDTSLIPSATFRVDVNITGASDFNGFDFAAYYDSNYIQASDASVGPIFINPSIASKELTPGRVRLAAVDLAGAYTGGSGTIAHIDFNVIAVGASPIVLAAGMGKISSFAQDWTRVVLGSVPLEVETADGSFRNVAGKFAPIADFTWAPPAPQQGDRVAFNATGSYDPYHEVNGPNITRGIYWFLWDFGDGQSNNTHTPMTSHRFASGTGATFSGNFSVRLTVVENETENFQGMVAKRVQVAPLQFHDVLVESITASPTSARPGDQVAITVVVVDAGTFSETFNLTVRNKGPPASLIGQKTNEPIASAERKSFSFTFDTTGLSLGIYSIAANVTIGISDTNPSNNEKSATVSISEAGQSPFLFIVAGVVVVIAALVVVRILLTRRRKRDIQ